MMSSITGDGVRRALPRRYMTVVADTPCPIRTRRGACRVGTTSRRRGHPAAPRAPAVDDAGCDGRIEVEIFNDGLWALPAEEALKLVNARYVMHVADDEVSS